MKRAVRRMRKTLVLVACVALITGLAVGGTLAWLVDDTEEITNTFTTAGIDITLIETKKPDGTVVEAGVTDWEAQLIPGMSYSKNPVVTVERPETDVDIYLFVKFEENVDEEVLTYTSTLTANNGWTELTANSGIWYREVKATDKIVSWNLLKDDTVSVNNTVTKEQIDLNSSADTKMEWTAYAIQTVKDKDNKLTPAEAWDILNPSTGA